MPRSSKSKRSSKTVGKNLVVWVRLPKGASIKVPGKKSAQLARFLKNAGLNPEARCFGGDSCIV